MTIIINNPGYTRIEQMIIKKAFNTLKRINKNNKSRHIAVLAYKDWPVTVGMNDETAFNRYAHSYLHNSVHAEWSCIRRFLRKNTHSELLRLTLYSVRINRFNEVCMAKPCRRCQAYIRQNPVKRTYFTNEFGEFEQWLP